MGVSKHGDPGRNDETNEAWRGLVTATAVRVCTRRRTWTAVQLAGFLLLAAAGAVSFFPGRATAAGPVVTIPTGNPTDGQTITVSGTGFPTRSQAPTGLTILECSDPGGTAAGLPTDATGCEGTTAKAGVFTDASGNFTNTFTVSLLNPSNSSIQCDPNNFCVLWVGVDYNTSFTSNSAFSLAFEVQGNTTTTTTTSTTTTTPTSTTTTSTPSTTTTTSSSTTTTSSSSTTTTTPSSTTTSSTSTTTGDTTSTTGAGDTTTTAPATEGASGTDVGSGGSGGGASGTVSASSGSLAFTGGPTALPWLIGVGVVLTVLGGLGRRLIPHTAP